MKGKIIIPVKGKLPEFPLQLQDIPANAPKITQSEIVAFATAYHIFRIARADFEANRAALSMKLLQCATCEEGHYFALLDEHDNLVIEDRTSLEMGTGRPILDRECIPSGGAA
jgi:hypothetical protein